MGKKKPFIDPKKAQTFRLMSKAEYDPDVESPNVLAPVLKKGETISKIVHFKDEILVEKVARDDTGKEIKLTQSFSSTGGEEKDGDERWEDEEDDMEMRAKNATTSGGDRPAVEGHKKGLRRRVEDADLIHLDYTEVEKDAADLGAYGLWNDGYDYLQHMKTVGGGMIIEAPHAVEEEEEDTGKIAVLDEKGNVIEVDKDEAAKYMDPSMLEGLFSDEEGSSDEEEEAGSCRP